MLAAARLASALAGIVALSISAGNDSEEVTAPEPEAFRDCRSAVVGELSGSYSRHAVTVGPLQFAGELGASAHRFRGDRELKVLVVMAAGQSVTVAVPEAERDRISLLYSDSGPGPRRNLRFSDGTSSVRFAACPEAETQFNGGFYARDVHCAEIEVWAEEGDGPLTGSLPLGDVKNCPPQDDDPVE